MSFRAGARTETETQPAGADGGCRPQCTHPLPEDSALAAAAVALNGAGYWAELLDRDFRHAFTTDELRTSYGEPLGLATVPLGAFYFGEEATAVRLAGASGPNTVESQRIQFAAIGGWALTDVPGGRDALTGMVASELRELVDGLKPSSAPAVSFVQTSTGFGGSTLETWATGVRIHAADGTPAGTALLYKPFVVAADRCIVDSGGLVGRHVGDGVAAFFLAETAGSESAAARACIAAARDLQRAMAGVAARSRLEQNDAVLRFGLHWGATAYVGWITTTGRSEVTALGDEVNEAARIEACASGGRMLASKNLTERLDPHDAAALGIEPDHVTYMPVTELSTATEKARRDAPAIAVCEL